MRPARPRAMGGQPPTASCLVLGLLARKRMRREVQHLDQILAAPTAAGHGSASLRLGETVRHHEAPDAEAEQGEVKERAAQHVVAEELRILRQLGETHDLELVHIAPWSALSARTVYSAARAAVGAACTA